MVDVFIFSNLSHHADYHFPLWRRRPPGVIVGTLESLIPDRLLGHKIRNAYWFTRPQTRQHRGYALDIDRVLERRSGVVDYLEDWPALRACASLQELEALLAKGYQQ